LSFGLGYLNYSQTFVDYLYDGAFNYLLYNSIFINFLQPRLPELFDNNIFTAVNGALWTIKIEVMFYMSVPLIYGALAKYVNTTILTIFFGLSSVLIYYCLPYIIDTYSLHPSLNNQLPSLMIFFMIGAMFNFLKLDFLKAGHIFIVLPMIYFLKDFYLPYSLTVGLFVYIFALKVKPINISKKIGDISYGVYIFHFPIIQALAMYGFFENFYLGLLIASVLVFGCSLISWHYIESKLIHKPKN
jgi:peptidoglycan/LPS O-acetylase OafA/YrhL